MTDENPQGTDPQRFRDHPLVSKLVPEPGKVPQVLLLTGFIGKSLASDHLRLYLTLQFNEFVDIPVEAIVHVVEAGEETLELDGDCIWVRADAEVTYGHSSTLMAQSEFLNGGFTEEFTHGAPTSSSQPGALRGATDAPWRKPRQHALEGFAAAGYPSRRCPTLQCMAFMPSWRCPSLNRCET